jgi:SAM-dependent methyltransferase
MTSIRLTRELPREKCMHWRTRVLRLAFPKRPGPGGTHAESAVEGPAEVFSRVYRDKHWGRRWGRKFFSGPGSHDPKVIGPYIQSVQNFLGEFPRPPDVVDLGCGDFYVGSQLRYRCGQYVACDVVPELIRHNAAAFANMKVEFACLNIIDDPLPAGEIAFLRQVLQHLSNAQIDRVLTKLGQYRFLVITEHLPATAKFIPNLDHSFGSGIRVTRNSGVVLTAPPFNLRVGTERELCRVQHGGGFITTVAYGLS